MKLFSSKKCKKVSLRGTKKTSGKKMQKGFPARDPHLNQDLLYPQFQGT